MRIFLFTLIYIFGFQTLFSQQNKNIKKPNILFIAVDDLKPTMGVYGDSFAITPNIDAIAKNGTTFLNNHVQQAICGPSRASVLTGKRPDYTKVWDLKTKMRDINPHILTIPEHFKNNGYQTIGLGKIYDPRCVDKDKDKPSWSVPHIKESTFKYPKGFKSPALGFYQSKEITTKVYALMNEAKRKGEKNANEYVRNRYKPPFENADVPDDAYVDGAIANRSIELLENMDVSQPFFLAVGFKRPHLPFVAPKKYWDMYDESKITLASYQKKSKNAVDIAYHKSGEMRSYKSPEIKYRSNNQGLLDLDKDFQIKLIHGYYAATSYIDAQIGKIVAKLKEKGLDKNTIIVLWGDHGWHLGDHSLWNKHSNFEQATRSPLVIYNPSVHKGFKIDTPTEFVDLFPTLTEMSGINTPKNLDGVSLNPQINGEKNTSKLFAVSQYPRGPKMGYSFRTKQYRYTVWINNKKSTEPIYKEDIHGEELYDYKVDFNETDNKIDDKDYQKIKTTFQTLAARYFNSQITTKKEVKTKINTQRKNKYAQNRADKVSEFIRIQMNLPSGKATFLNETLYTKYASNAEKTRGKGLTNEEKGAIYKATFTATRKILIQKFSQKEITEINKLERIKQKELSNKN